MVNVFFPGELEQSSLDSASSFDIAAVAQVTSSRINKEILGSNQVGVFGTPVPRNETQLHTSFSLGGISYRRNYIYAQKGYNYSSGDRYTFGINFPV